jgi:hypothetical protein
MLGIARRQSAAAVASAARRAAVAPKNARSMSMGEMDAYGSQCFIGAVADKVQTRACLGRIAPARARRACAGGPQRTEPVCFCELSCLCVTRVSGLNAYDGLLCPRT